MSDTPNFKALLTDDVTSAALRADGIEPRDFLRTLEGAAMRLKASKRCGQAPLEARQACWNAMRSMTLSRCGA